MNGVTIEEGQVILLKCILNIYENMIQKESFYG